ncbi:MAG: lycopene cyclase domain-containing protein [Candidatus Uhrbacteria bacterium]
MSNLPFLLLSLALFFIWTLLFFFGRQTRREQIIMSLVGVVLTPAIILIAVNDYLASDVVSHGSIGLENFIFAFSLTGTAAVAYEILVGRRLKNLRHKHFWGPHHLNWLATLVILLGAWAGVSSAMFFLFPIGSIYSFIVGGLLVTTFMIAERHDLLIDSLFSGLFTVVLVFGLEQIFLRHIFVVSSASLWQIDQLSGFSLNQIPVEEIIWIMVVGMAIGPVYEFVRHYRVKT